ncbi:ATP-dependent DNA helicase RecG [Terasakiispira papahanaumokuakeensis]|uniref:ATP-dependent DNA helicase RecG n=1 Tax=Terasakiispira papahanaumokuakeensis TaxID=197479 RepID=A0A1E2VDL8_9GAMM|nr:ATP-dependent DNA helicase RecG [Terasakiispira papahanaumokuakeensis]ODC04952.1 ATP-dependent DNA helicase RecG [Terasakiispira papahanaumokuakeensis]
MPNDVDQPLVSRPLTTLKGVGPALAEKLARLGLSTLQDLLFHLPLRYEDRTHRIPIGRLKPGSCAVIEGTVSTAQVIQSRRRSLLVRLQDGSGALGLRFFHFTAALKQQMMPGRSLRCYGEARPGATGLEFYHPELMKTDTALDDANAHLTPVYPSTEGLQQPRLRQLIEQALEMMQQTPPEELLPEPLRQSLQLPSLTDAIMQLHAPNADTDIESFQAGQHPAQQRLAFEELLAHQLSMLKLRSRMQRFQAPKLNGAGDWDQAFRQQLPFQLTAAQQRVLGEIDADLQQGHPMLRLVQGDVGSGKTVVAALACLRAIAHGYQAALMAPTEILAEQHYHSLTQWLAPLGLKTTWLAGKLKGKQRDAALTDIASGEAHMVVGTHALFQNQVQFHRLGLVVIDEQHRFGVHQRLALAEKADLADQQPPHQLIMTATPIPRTLAMSAYADLNCSVIDELPPGRTPVKTVALPDSRRSEVIERIRSACASGRQAYWVCTLVEESEALECQAAEVTWAQLQEALPELRIGLVHGRMKAADKTAVMTAFKAAELDLLVATTVIEVGVDVPNASLMIIDNAERFGLAQLHQLRGRVGRGATESFCVLLYHPPLSETGHARLDVMRNSNDGFVIAQTDLEIRGPGELLGTRQTGELNFRIANLQRDGALLDQLAPIARQLIRDYPTTAEALLNRWQGDRERYARA